jgi:AraC-like DNA-binding protein
MHDGAHQRCGSQWGCDRKFYPGHQIMFMLSGRGHGTYDGQPWTAHAGDAVLMDLRTWHTYYSAPHDPWEMYWVRLDGPGVSETFTRMIESAGSPVMPFASRAKLDDDFRAIFEQLAGDSPGYEGWIFHRLTGLIANVAEGLRRRDATAGMKDESPQSGGITAAIALLRAEHRRNLSLGELARAAHMSVFHFARRFKHRTGFTPMEYLEKLRISRAQELILSEPEFSVKQIASATGYDDAAYFSRVFRKCTGVSPRDYRQTIGVEGLGR